MMSPFRRRVKESVQRADKLSLIGLTFHAGQSYWGIHPHNYHIDDFSRRCHGTFPRAPTLIEWKLNLLTFFSACYRLSTRCQCSRILHRFLISNIFKSRREMGGGGVSPLSVHHVAPPVQLFSCSALQPLCSSIKHSNAALLLRHKGRFCSSNEPTWGLINCWVCVSTLRCSSGEAESEHLAACAL